MKIIDVCRLIKDGYSFNDLSDEEIASIIGLLPKIYDPFLALDIYHLSPEGSELSKLSMERCTCLAGILV